MADRQAHVSRIEPHEQNVRQDLGDLAELAASIRAQGILQPLVVCVHPWRPGCFQLLAGHRRLAAAKLAGLDYVPVVVRQAAEEPRVPMLVENLQRAQLTAVEKAEAFGALLAQPGWNVARISRETGLAESGIYRYLDLLKLDEASLDRVRSGQVRVGDAIDAVRGTRAAARPPAPGQRRRTSPEPRRKVAVGSDHFSGSHPLAGDAQVRCELAGHAGRKYGTLHGRANSLACGACWEAVIRADARRTAPAGAR